MNIRHTKTYVSYQGGSGGDMLCASLNHIDITLSQPGYVINHAFTIKQHEPFADATDLQQRAEAVPYDYVSTHEFGLLDTAKVPMINVTIQDPDIAKVMILRQMSLQHLRILADDASHWFQITRGLCQAGRYRSAAQYWLALARQLWHDQMALRLEHTAGQFCADRIFDPGFARISARSLPALDTDLFRENHRRWLAKNHRDRWTEHQTLHSMEHKLSHMDWTQTTGMVQYQ